MPKVDDEKIPGPVTVEMFFADNRKALNLLWIAGKNGGDREIREASIHRPGLALTGFLDYFADKRIQIIGSAENAFLASLTGEKIRQASLREKFPLCDIHEGDKASQGVFGLLRQEQDSAIFLFDGQL
jgi:serine kinase of HPr protein (carbohydrate metabolism regulator)